MFVLKADNTTHDQRDTARDGVETALQDAYNDNRIPGFEIRTYNTTKQLSSVCAYNGDGEGEQYVSNHFGDEDDGCFLWVTQFTESYACGYGAWNDRRLAQVSALKHTGSSLEAIAAQEMLHTFIKGGGNACPYVEDMLGSGGSGEHNLGTVLSGSTAAANSAMAATYKDAPNVGECSSSTEVYTKTPQISECTRKAIEFSKEHANGNHNH